MSPVWDIRRKGKEHMKKRFWLVLALLLSVSSAAACGKAPVNKKGATTEEQEAVHQQNFSIMYDSLKITEKNIEKILSILEKEEPGQAIESVEDEVESVDGGVTFRVTFRNGSSYLVNTSIVGEPANVRNEKTGETVWTRSEADDDRELRVDFWEVNRQKFSELGFSEEEAEKLTDAVNRAVPGDVIESAEVGEPDEDGNRQVYVTTESRRTFLLVLYDQENVVGTFEQK